MILKIGNIFTDIEGDVPSNIKDGLKKELSFRPLGYQFNPKFAAYLRDKDGKPIRRMWDGYKYQFWSGKKRTYFPTGLYSIVSNFLDNNNAPYHVIDCRIKPQQSLFLDYADDMIIRDYQSPIINIACEKTRGIIQAATGAGKCLAKGTPVLMFDGTIKNVEDVVINDLLMGPDSTPRRVLSLSCGQDKMYTIIPKKGMPFTVNEPHILSLVMTNGYKHKKGGQIINMSVSDYLKQNSTFKHCAKGYRVPIDFKQQDVPLDPYFLGIWLGDGHSRRPSITTADTEIVDFIKHFANSMDISIRIENQKSNCKIYHLTTGKKGSDPSVRERNKVLDLLRSLNLLKNKHIPMIYKANSREIRLLVLAGLIDADGSMQRNCYDYVSISPQLASDVAYLARSLGLRATISVCRKKCTNNGVIGEYSRVIISGDCSIIPVKISRKKAVISQQKKNCLNFGFDVKYAGVGDYYGFEIDKDRLFLLGDFTVTHNTAIGAGIIKELKVSPFIFFVTSIDLLTQAKESFEKFLRFHGSNLKVGQVGGGVIDIADVNVMTVQTAVRALGSAWNKDTKFDTDDTDDDTSIDSRKEEIKELINSAAGAIGDEIQHWRANTCQLVARELKNAYYTYGLSATPYRDEGDDLMIQACFGKKIATISASQLIRDGWLIKPQIKFVNFRNMHSKYKTWQPIYKEMITENDYYNKSCASIANKYIENDRIVLVLVQHVKHGKDLADMIDGAKFLSGSSPKKQRQEGIEQLRSKKIKCIVSTQIFDEGIDVRSLDTLLLCGQGKSKVRAMQRIGRILRPYTDPVTGKVKTTATAIDFKLHCKYLKQHANEREAMYRTEEEFAIEHIG